MKNVQQVTIPEDALVTGKELGDVSYNYNFTILYKGVTINIARLSFIIDKPEKQGSNYLYTDQPTNFIRLFRIVKKNPVAISKFRVGSVYFESDRDYNHATIQKDSNNNLVIRNTTHTRERVTISKNNNKITITIKNWWEKDGLDNNTSKGDCGKIGETLPLRNNG